MRRLTSINGSSLWLIFPSRCTNSIVWLYTLPAALRLICGSLRHHLRPTTHDLSLGLHHGAAIATYTTMITPIVFLSYPGHCETTPVSPAACPAVMSSRVALRRLPPSTPPPPDIIVRLQTRLGSLQTRLGSLQTRLGSLQTRLGSLHDRYEQNAE